MIKRTLCFSNPAYLSLKNKQLVINYPNDLPSKSAAIEDIGVLVLEHGQITLTNALLEQLTIHNIAVINCNQQHMPIGLLLPLSGHTQYSERIQLQLAASVPLKKNLWQQTIKAKINNQAALLTKRNVAIENMHYWSQSVQSGDMQNHEARAAAYYWANLFNDIPFKRGQFESAPNNLLNYGYAILRAVCARALISSGMLPVMGIHHKNKYNAYCLADDIMEPYRPFVDEVVCYIVDNHDDTEELTPALKQYLLQIPALDVVMDDKKSPLMVAMSRTTNSLYECYAGVRRKVLYPDFPSVD
jgi:CRISPR-associated protein Cas1